jgi:hypothetical protein
LSAFVVGRFEFAFGAVLVIGLVMETGLDNSIIGQAAAGIKIPNIFG